MKKLIFSLFVIIVFAFSCTKQSIIEREFIQGRVLFASFYNEYSDTKIGLNEDRRLYWNHRDSISYFRSQVNEKYFFNGEDGSLNGTFSASDSQIMATHSNTIAVFPYSSINKCDGSGRISTSVPNVQHFHPNSFDPNSNIMISVSEKTEDDSLCFKNAMGYLKFKITGGDKIASMSICGNNNESLAGDVEISTHYGENPIANIENGYSSIELNCGCGVQLDESADTDFWIVLPPITFERGITVTLTNVYGQSRVKTTSVPIRVNRNTVTTIKSFDFSISGRTDLLSFSLFDGIQNYYPISIADSLVYIIIPPSADLKNLVASFEHNGAKAYIDKKEVQSGIGTFDYSNFADPHYLTIQSSKGIEKSYKIVVFDLPVLSIETPGHNIVTRNYLTDASFVLWNESGSKIMDVLTSIKGRGNSTWAYTDKKAYALKLNEKSKVLGMPKSKRWNLLASSFDRTLIRNDVTFEVSRRTTGLEWSPRGSYIELLLNGSHRGLYYIMESVKIDNKRIPIQEMTESDIDSVSVTGGYVLEYTRIPEKYNFTSQIYNYQISLTSPDENVPQEQMDYIQSHVNYVESIVNNPDSIQARVYAKYLDVESFIDWWLVHEVAHSSEQVISVPLSAYIYKDRDVLINGKLEVQPFKAGPVWDFDKPTYDINQMSLLIGKNALYLRNLWDDPVFKARAKEKWAALKSELTDENNSIISYIEQRYNLLYKSAYRDEAMWGVASIGNSDNALPYNQAIENMKYYVDTRIKIMDVLINNL